MTPAPRILRSLVATLGLALLVACGADGPPEPPASRAGPGIAVSGSAGIGLSGGS
jgi:predicted small lipoprotein YifL